MARWRFAPAITAVPEGFGRQAGGAREDRAAAFAAADRARSADRCAPV